MSTRTKVERLLKQNKTYDEISLVLGISKSCVYWHASDRNREYAKQKRRDNRTEFVKELKMKYGGKCSKCGYDKCLGALQFHHTNPENKHKVYRKGHRIGVTNLSRQKGQRYAEQEAAKCILICANCHAEEHWPNK